MKFGPLQKTYFKADDGAYSIVTERERVDGQITITEKDGEADIVLSVIKRPNIPRGGAKGQRQKVVVIQRNGKEQAGSVTINFPKSDRDELRIYRAEAEGFDFDAGDVWFVFKRAGGLFAGCMNESQWRSIGTLDHYDAEFQDSVDSVEPRPSVKEVEFAGKRFQRDPAISRRAIAKSGFICEYSGKPTPYLSKRTGKPYIEAHHLIPLGLQGEFDFPLDCTENVIALNPLWHRAIHHAEPKTVQTILDSLRKKRRDFLKAHKISRNQLIYLYGCEDIV